MRRLQRFLAPFLVATLACTSSPKTPTGATGSPEAEVDTASIPFKGDTLVFPPAPTGRERRPLPARFAKVDEEEAVVPLGVSWPELDSDNKFEFSGETLSIRFNRKMVHGKNDAPPLTVTPKVKGKARWSSDWSVVFTADRPFDPEVVYAVKLGEVADEKGETLTWEAKFQADPQIWIAGKLITYLPRPGKPRVVAVRPHDGVRVGTQPTLEVLFDQPVATSDVEKLITLSDQKTRSTVLVALRHPAKALFDGTKVAKEHVVLVEPAAALEAGRKYQLAARDHGAKRSDAETIDLTVAKPLEFTGVDCGYRTEGCAWSGSKSTLAMEGREFSLRFNNTIDPSSKAKQALTIEPPVRNLSVYPDRWSSDGRITVAGAFAPSTEYTVTLMHTRDVYGSMLLRPIVFTVTTSPMPASVAMADGVQFLDGVRSGAFELTTRNVKTAKLRFWEVGDNDKDWREANRQVSNREAPSGTPKVELDIEPRRKLDTAVTTKVNLLEELQAGHSYVAQLELDDVAFGAPKPEAPEWSWAGKPLLTLLTLNGDDAIAVHARSVSDKTLVYASNVATGDPIADAALFLDGEEIAGVRTNPRGFAIIDLSRDDAQHKVLRLQHGDTRALLPLGDRTQSERDLVPEFASGATGELDRVRALVISDRGVYRPGATVFFKAMVRRPEGGDLVPTAYIPTRLQVVDPNGKKVYDQVMIADDKGSVSGSWESPEGAEIGRHEIRALSGIDGSLLATTQVQITEFEPPRFKVDVEATEKDRKLAAVVEGRYLFGAAMNGATTYWTLRRNQAPMPSGAFTARGLTFRKWRYSDDAWSRTGSGTLDDVGKLALTPVLELDDAAGPQSFTLEAEVTDSSHRSIAGRTSVVVHPHENYAGIRITDWSADQGKPVPLELGVINTSGEAVTGKSIKARLFHLEWKRTRRPGPGGSARVEWHEERNEIGSCTAVSALSPVSCDVIPKLRGSYEVEAIVDGQVGGVEDIWVWGSGSGSVAPEPGNRVNVLADKKSYAPGEVAKVIVQNPFESATAIFTVEQGSVLHHETKVIPAGPAEFAVDIKADYAPRVHATVTLLPIAPQGDELAAWKFGAVRLPVELDGVRLDVAVTSDKPHYEPQDTAQITVAVTSGGKPVVDAEVALAIVDEGILRLTNFRVADPVAELRPGAALHFDIADTRYSLAEMLERSHTAGDGDGGGAESSLVSTRKNFVRTALWKPQLRTDANGLVKLPLELPDNLTEFRMMAVVLDERGRGGSKEGSFEVRKPLMLIPAVPRFALTGDTYDAGVMVHNGEDEAVTATVSLGSETQTVELAARGRKLVSFVQTASVVGDNRLVFEAKDKSGTIRDRVESLIPVQTAGMDQRPRIAGSFDKVQEVLLEVPAGVYTDLEKDAFVTVTLGHDIWPELGTRLEFLVDYPHGCVEQTTSSTLPLLAARDILPRLGFFRYTTEEIDERAMAGIKRLATMKTSGGGLAYWPGDTHPDLYGTAYAMRAVSLAAKQGIEVPGLKEGMVEYLEGALSAGTMEEARDVETKASIALALAEGEALPESAADMLFDSVDKQGVFGLASLVLAISTLPAQDDRVKDLLDRIEAGFNETGGLIATAPRDEFYYYGSQSRTKAQAALALIRLRPNSKVIPGLLEDLVRTTERYTTQATAFGLIALRERVVATAKNEGKLTVRLDGKALSPDFVDTMRMGGGAVSVTIPLAELAGKQRLLRLESTGDVAAAFVVRSQWREPLVERGGMSGTSSENGPEFYRVFTDPKGNPVDMDAIEPGTVVRVALLARIPEGLNSDRRGYLAMTDRIPAGFEPIQPDLWTVSRPDEVESTHPLYELLRWHSGDASHLELRDDRVLIYFDRFWGDYVSATYTMRATTPGQYVIPPAVAELMYEADATGYSQFAQTKIIAAAPKK